MPAMLTYYIFEGLLVGNAGGRSFYIHALSGGGSGSTKGAGNSAGNNPYSTGLKTSGAAGSASHVHGGPVPLGKYRIHRPAFRSGHGKCAVLEPQSGSNRSGFLIHGRGPHGSDGCIVPLSQFPELMAALEKENGGTLFVEETSGGARFA